MPDTSPAQAYRQGDVPLIPFNGSLATFDRVAPNDHAKLVLALGEATGHHHRVENCTFSSEPMEDAARMYRDPATGAQVLEIGGGGPQSLVHEEHTAIPLPPGRYLQLVQVEDDAEMIAAVAD